MELSSMTIVGGTASLTLLVSSYHGDGSYKPGGALNTIVSQQLGTYPVSGGAVTIMDSGTQGSMDLSLTASTGQQVRIQGTWACG